MIQLTDERYWLLAAVDPATNEFARVRPLPTRSTGLTGIFLDELREKHDVDDALFLVDAADRLNAALHRLGYEYRHERHGRRNCVERIIQQVNGNTYQFKNCFGNAEASRPERPPLPGRDLWVPAA